MANFHKYFLLTIDVEDWFQVENFKPWILSSTWDQRELRVERNVHRILDFFDSIELKRPVPQNYEKPTKSSHPTQTHSTNPGNRQPVKFPPGRNEVNLTRLKNPKATFFVLGWIAERIPHLVREIKSRGHEVASHGYNHELCHEVPHNDLKADLIKSKKLLRRYYRRPHLWLPCPKLFH